jgi:hypothetical protein
MAPLLQVYFPGDSTVARLQNAHVVLVKIRHMNAMVMIRLKRFLPTDLPAPVPFLVFLTVLLAACAQVTDSPPDAVPEETPGDAVPMSSAGERYSDYEIITVLPRDAIPAIDDPKFISVAEASESYADDELILGVEFNGDARAYSVPLLSSHEIVNDTVGSVKIAVTW